MAVKIDDQTRTNWNDATANERERVGVAKEQISRKETPAHLGFLRFMMVASGFCGAASPTHRLFQRIVAECFGAPPSVWGLSWASAPRMFSITANGGIIMAVILRRNNGVRTTF